MNPERITSTAPDGTTVVGQHLPHLGDAGLPVKELLPERRHRQPVLGPGALQFRLLGA